MSDAIVMTPLDPVALGELARKALADGEEEGALPLLAEAAARVGDDARLWQWTGLLHRALHQHQAALEAFERAAMLASSDPSIALARAQTAMEAGYDARTLFGGALMLDQSNGDTVLGLAASRFAAGVGAAAADELEALLVNNPGWVPGHHGLARLRAMLGDGEAATRSIETALVAMPDSVPIWGALITLLFRARRFAEAHEVILRARTVLGADAFEANEAVILSELGDARADALFAGIESPDDLPFTIHRIRWLLRSGRAAEALPLVERWIGAPDADTIWPYAALVWRVTGDPRWEWLEGDARLISVTDLSDRLPPLAELLRSMHIAQGQPLDQSVRGGTQTDGILFTRIEPEIAALRAVIVDAAAAHIAQLPPPDPAHPTLGLRRDRPIRFSGAWSVRLTAQGHHASHNHPLGWFSSALYIALPDGEAGGLSLGEAPADLGLNLPPLGRIAPKPGQLVLFPSTLWHSTVPFDAGERLTVAFDVARPR